MRSHDSKVAPEFLQDRKLKVRVVQICIDVVLPSGEEGKDGLGRAGGCWAWL